MSLKAISLWQPWASAMAEGRKRNETRGHLTHYRGELAIHASKRKPTAAEFPGMEAERLAFIECGTFGAIVCVVKLYDCLPTDLIKRGDFHVLDPHIIGKDEYDLGDYSPGRFAWMTHSLVKLREPVPISGRQGFFYLSDAVEKQVRRMMKPK